MFLFTMFFHLLMLPFTLIRMAFALLGISTHILLIPPKIFARHTVLCLGIAAVIILYLAIKKDPHSVDNLKPTLPTESAIPPELRAAPYAAQPNGAPPPTIQPVIKREDGNSLFAVDAYTQMTEPERAAYSKAFYTAMNTIADGQPYAWNYYNIQGTLQPTQTFRNKNGLTCRKFSEVLKVHQVEQTLNGTACDNGGRTWCKLKLNATPSCGIGSQSPSMFDDLGRAIRNLF